MISLMVFLSGILCLIIAGFFLKKLISRGKDESFVLKADFLTITMAVFVVIGFVCIVIGIVGMLKAY